LLSHSRNRKHRVLLTPEQNGIILEAPTGISSILAIMNEEKQQQKGARQSTL
jgi:hypothetical protein